MDQEESQTGIAGSSENSHLHPVLINLDPVSKFTDTYRGDHRWDNTTKSDLSHPDSTALSDPPCHISPPCTPVESTPVPFTYPSPSPELTLDDSLEPNTES